MFLSNIHWIRHDFCWVCLESWDKHGAKTGGYFQCNRYINITPLKDKNKGVTSHHKSLHRFIHYYTRYQSLIYIKRNIFTNFIFSKFSRYKNHADSRMMEEPLLRSAKRKREVLRSSLTTDVIERKWFSISRRDTWLVRSDRNWQSTWLIWHNVWFPLMKMHPLMQRDIFWEMINQVFRLCRFIILLDFSTNVKLFFKETREKNTQFYEDGVWELVKSRACLCGSYAYGFFLEEDSSSITDLSQVVWVNVFRFMFVKHVALFFCVSF